MNGNMPERHPLRTFPVSAGMDPEHRMKLAIELTERAMACMNDRPAQAARMLEEARQQLGQARGALWARVQPKWWTEGWG